MVTTFDGRETEVEIVAIKAQKIRWRVDKEIQKFEGLIRQCGVDKEFAPF
jgi:hypothetical protein